MSKLKICLNSTCAELTEKNTELYHTVNDLKAHVKVLETMLEKSVLREDDKVGYALEIINLSYEELQELLIERRVEVEKLGRHYNLKSVSDVRIIEKVLTFRGFEV
jgi:predicted HTH domain antitoxin